MLFYNNIIIENFKIKSYLKYDLSKNKLYTLSKNEDLRFLKFDNNLYKSLLKSYVNGYIIKLHSWDYDYLKKEYEISIKLKNIINFIDYICYFDYETNFIDYINSDSDYDDFSESDNIYDEQTILFMHNYNTILSISEKNISNIYTQFILALYSSYYNHNIYFTDIDNKFIFIVKNNYPKKYKYIINDNITYVKNSSHKIIIADLSKYKLGNDIDIDSNILTLISKINNIFSKNIIFTIKDLKNIKYKFVKIK